MNRPLVIIASILIVASSLSAAVRIKDMGNLEGSNELRLIGYGLVVGLEGTGDSPKSLFTNQALTNMLQRFGITIESDRVRASNVAAVIVTAEVPPYTRAGGHFDVIVASTGDAKSLQGGVLLQTLLADASGAMWGVASGPISIGGFNVEAGNVSVRQNYAGVGRVPQGGVMEVSFAPALSDGKNLNYLLRHGDFATARRVADAINQHFNLPVAQAVDAVSIVVTVPDTFATSGSLVPFVAEFEDVTFEPDIVAKVVINERTGTIVIGEHVSLSTVAISHGALSITIKSTPNTSQPMPYSQGQTTTNQYQEVTVEQRGTGVVVIPGTTSVGDVAAALNRLGVTPRDIIAIFQALKQSGALQAELEII